MRYTTVLLLAALSTCSANPAFADAPTCAAPTSIAEFVAGMEARPEAASVHVASEREAKAAVEIINALPPETDDTYDSVALVTAHNGAGAVFYGNGGICRYTPFPADRWLAFVRSVRGQGV